MFFLTICCETRGNNQLCQPSVAEALLSAARYYHEKHDWYLRMMLLMPDHVHALIAPALDDRLNDVVGNWKRYVGLKTGVVWQKNFFDHRLRSAESWNEKVEYIRANPVRAGLIGEGETWPYQLEH